MSRYEELPRWELDDEEISGKHWEAYQAARAVPGVERRELAALDALSHLSRVDVLRVAARSIRVAADYADEQAKVAARHRPLAPLALKGLAVAVVAESLNPDGPDDDVIRELVTGCPAGSWPMLAAQIATLVPALAGRDALEQLAQIALVVQRGEGVDDAEPPV